MKGGNSMKRIPKYRAKDHYGKWHYGFIWGSVDPESEEEKYRAWYIHNGVSIAMETIVDRDTIGQYTGLKDAAGIEVWEGDIVNVVIGIANDEEKRGGIKDMVVRVPVEFHEGCFIVGNKNRNGLLKAYTHPRKKLNVIGNIHDNPELLK